jgi:hypothetical protein
MLLRTRSQSVPLGYPEIVIDPPLPSRSLRERDDTCIVAPNGVDESQYHAVCFDEGYVQPAFLPSTFHFKGHLVRILEYNVGIIEVGSVLLEVRLALGLVPFVHGVGLRQRNRRLTQARAVRFIEL